MAVTHCGKRVLSTWSFCPFCGRSLKTSSADEEQYMMDRWGLSNADVMLLMRLGVRTRERAYQITARELARLTPAYSGGSGMSKERAERIKNAMKDKPPSR